MRVQLLIPALVLTATLSQPAEAAETWTEAVSRGLTTYSLGDASAGITIVCDPDRVFGPSSNGNIHVRFADDANPSTVVLLSQTGQQAALPVSNGRVLQAGVPAEDWAGFIELVSQGGEFALVTPTASMIFDAAPLPGLACN
jgi:hypothetical protein